MSFRPEISHLVRLAVFGISAGLIGLVTSSGGRSPTGDAPVLLGRARRMAAAVWSGDLAGGLGAWIGQVVPQPPLGYASAGFFYFVGLEQWAPLACGLLSLGMIGLGLTWMGQEERAPLGWPPLAAWMMLLASPMIWSALENVQWDLICAGWVCLSLGALVRSRGLEHRGWTIAAGVLAGLSAMVKYNAPFFLWLPLLWACVAAARGGRRRDGGVLIAAGAAPLLLWLPFALPELLPYLASSVDGTPGVDSASEVPRWTERLRLSVLVYYPAVLKDAVGWPGLAICLGALGAWRMPVGRVLWLVILGGGISLSLTGRREPRYLLPLLPVLFLAAELGWGRLNGRIARRAAGLGIVTVAGIQLWGTASAYQDWPDPRPLAQLAFGPETFTRASVWPRPAPAFVPTSTLASVWKVPDAVSAIGEEVGPGATVGFLLYANPRVPPADLFILEAGQRGWTWDRVELDILSAHHAGPPPPEVRPGRVAGGHRDPDAPRRPQHPPPRPPEEEAFTIRAEPGPVASLVKAERFSVLYAIHPRGEPFYRAFFLQLAAEEVQSIALPQGFVGTLWRLSDEVWEGELGQQLEVSL